MTTSSPTLRVSTSILSSLLQMRGMRRADGPSSGDAPGGKPACHPWLAASARPDREGPASPSGGPGVEGRGKGHQEVCSPQYGQSVTASHRSGRGAATPLPD